MSLHFTAQLSSSWCLASGYTQLMSFSVLDALMNHPDAIHDCGTHPPWAARRAPSYQASLGITPYEDSHAPKLMLLPRAASSQTGHWDCLRAWTLYPNSEQLWRTVPASALPSGAAGPLSWHVAAQLLFLLIPASLFPSGIMPRAHLSNLPASHLHCGVLSHGT